MAVNVKETQVFRSELVKVGIKRDMVRCYEWEDGVPTFMSERCSSLLGNMGEGARERLIEAIYSTRSRLGLNSEVA
jgi:hypothetical protein